MPELFRTRLAPHFADQPKGERLYEVITPDGNRIATASTILACDQLTADLNETLSRWVVEIGPDAVVDDSD